MLKLLPLLFLCLGAAQGATTINGAGATFPFPLYSKWFAEYSKIDRDTRVNYNSIGSGGGIRQLTDKTVDFGASDAPMTDEQLAKFGGAVLHVPTVLGAVAITYNLKGVSGTLRLTPGLMADIFLGKITKWNDERLQKENPGLKLPDLALVPVYRSDGSGTTAIFTDYLSKTSPEWKAEVGHGTAVKWKTGIGGKGNEGVTGQIKQMPGAVGYVEFIYARSNHMPVAEIRNKAGRFVTPTVHAITTAAQASLKTMPADFRVSITDPEGKESYPISGFTYILIPTRLSKEKGKKILNLLNWMIGPAQEMAGPLDYAPLPKSLQRRVKDAVKKIKIE
jgi:phosphate transport system substrate-binding protein